MLTKLGGRSRVSKLLSRSGYGKGGATKAAEGASGQKHSDIASHLTAVEKEVNAEGNAPKSRLDRKSRSSGGRNWLAKTLKKLH